MFSNFVFAMIVLLPFFTVFISILVITNRVGLTAILLLSIKVYYLQQNNMKISEIINTPVADKENAIDHNV
jgi:hypothetical protein